MGRYAALLPWTGCVSCCGTGSRYELMQLEHLPTGEVNRCLAANEAVVDVAEPSKAQKWSRALFCGEDFSISLTLQDGAPSFIATLQICARLTDATSFREYVLPGPISASADATSGTISRQL